MRANTPHEVQLLNEQAVFLGTRSQFVQGAGGNLSVKISDSLWIKASGTRLAEADSRQIFVELDLESARSAVLEREDLSDLVLHQTESLRPSIETAIHSLMPHRFVSHVHLTGAIARAISRNAPVYATELSDLAKSLFVPYAKPGIELANKILSELARAEVTHDIPLLILLGNHGLIVASDSHDQVIDLLVTVEQRWRTPAVIAEEGMQQRGWTRWYPQGTLGVDQSNILLGGVLTPDCAVFLGPQPWISLGDVGKDLLPTTVAAVDDDGAVWLRDDISEDSREIAGSFVEIARAFPAGDHASYLDDGEVSALVNWDAEKWRKAQER